VDAREKPLGRKAYFKIPHLPGSRTGKADRVAPEELVRRCTALARDGEEVIVQEKLDGSCVAIAKVKGEVIALGREGVRASESLNPGRQKFARWVEGEAAMLGGLLKEGEWLVGKWLALAHSTRYLLTHVPFVAFDLFSGGAQLSIDLLKQRVGGKLPLPNLIHRGGPISVEAALALLGSHGAHGAVDPVEGAVWRLERAGEVRSMAKVVRLEKVDGVLLPENSGLPAVWNA